MENDIILVKQLLNFNGNLLTCTEFLSKFNFPVTPKEHAVEYEEHAVENEEYAVEYEERAVEYEEYAVEYEEHAVEYEEYAVVFDGCRLLCCSFSRERLLILQLVTC